MIDTKTKICDLLRETKRCRMDHLIEYMEDNGFFTSPASASNHLNHEGGLAEHSLNVLNQALALNKAFGNVCNVDSVIICALLHDLGKIGQYGKPEYVENILKSGKKSDSKPYEKNKDLLPVEHEVRSVAIASRFIDLTEDEQFTILMHNGMYGPFKYGLQGKETPLYMIIHFADMWASRVME